MLSVLVRIRLKLDLILLAQRSPDLKRVNAVKSNSVAEQSGVRRQIRNRKTVDLNRRKHKLADFFF